MRAVHWHCQVHKKVRRPAKGKPTLDVLGVPTFCARRCWPRRNVSAGSGVRRYVSECEDCRAIKALAFRILNRYKLAYPLRYSAAAILEHNGRAAPASSGEPIM